MLKCILFILISLCLFTQSFIHQPKFGRFKSGLYSKLSPRFYDTLRKTCVELMPLSDKHVSFYSCGPTLYNSPHIGNWRTFLFYDFLKRWLLYCGFDVNHVCNLTDIDDKIIQIAKEGNVTIETISRKYESIFFQDMKAFGILPATYYPRVTDNIPSIIRMIEGLLESQHAYFANDSVYFNISTFPAYGRIVDWRPPNTSLEIPNALLNKNRNKALEKKNSSDFVLWKHLDRKVDGVGYDSTFGFGRPGWHIECSTLASHFLGETIDIHGGGMDLKFPHHANEMAQSEAYSGKPLANIWMHSGFLNINKEKMSKSLNNYWTVEDLERQDARACRAFRLLCYGSRYNQSIDFTTSILQQHISTMKKIDGFAFRLLKRIRDTSNENSLDRDSLTFLEEIPNPWNLSIPYRWKESSVLPSSWNAALLMLQTAFEAALMDDLNAPVAMSVLFSSMSTVEQWLKNPESSASQDTWIEIWKFILSIDSVLALLPRDPHFYSFFLDPIVPEEVAILAQKRAECRDKRDYVQADIHRASIQELGFLVVDGLDGTYSVERIQ